MCNSTILGAVNMLKKRYGCKVQIVHLVDQVLDYKTGGYLNSTETTDLRKAIVVTDEIIRRFGPGLPMSGLYDPRFRWVIIDRKYMFGKVITFADALVFDDQTWNVKFIDKSDNHYLLQVESIDNASGMVSSNS